MALSKTQQALITKVRAVGGGELGISLDEPTCCYLVGVVARDLGCDKDFPELPAAIPPFFGPQPSNELRLPGLGFEPMVERLFEVRQDSDAYFYCLATLHKARLKYERILQAQPIPTIEQVGPRGLLQYGKISPNALAGFLYWRKWIFDIDNRAAQETGYLFEPVISHSIGGVTVSAPKSPIKRAGSGAGRQVDCIRESDKKAYEIKLRVTIAASGQGRWAEEMEFPIDCRASGYTPVLIVLDSTENPKLKELREAFLEAKGEVYVGPDAWGHLENVAGKTMAIFLETYVRTPMSALLKEAPSLLPELFLQMHTGRLVVAIGKEHFEFDRAPNAALGEESAAHPGDVEDHIPGA